MEKISTAYIIRWLKAEKPEYQFGELLPTEQGRLLPTPPVAYYNLNALLLYLKNRFQYGRLAILAMGFEETDKETVRRWSSGQSFVAGFKYLERPVGKKRDGSPIRAILIDDKPEDLKLLKQLILDEHFEMVTMSRNPDSAIKFFRNNHRHIDLVLTEAYIGYGNMFEEIREMKKLKSGVRIVVITSANTRADIQRLVALGVDGCLVKPVGKDRLMTCLRTVCSW
jgi:CheY-like chemotaxis protein